MERTIKAQVEIDGTKYEISRASIQQPMNGHHTFEVRRPISEKEKSLADAGNAHIGKEIKIDLSAGASKNAQNLFKGFITGVSLSKQQGVAIELVYQGHSPTILMDDGQHCQSFEKKAIDAIAKDVAGKYSLSLKADTAYKNPVPYLVQYRETGFHFLSRLAGLYGEWFYYDGTELYFGKAPKSSPVELVFGRDLSNFDLGLNLVPIKFKQLGYDHLGHQFPESSSGSASVSELDDYGKIASGASEKVFKYEPTYPTPQEIQDKSDLDEFTKHLKSAKAGNLVILNGSSDNNLLKLGSIVSIKGKLNASEVSYGEYRIIKITHVTDGLGNYSNQFKAIPSGLKEPPGNPAVAQPVCEVQAAEVLENHDPEGLGRVRVQCWWQKSTDDKTPWIRVSAAGAGGAHGSYFVPEKNDQVLVAFEHGNPNKPYVIGSLYHGKSKPAGGLSDPSNNNKSLKTKSGNQITLSDKGGSEEIKIVNGSNTITLSLAGPGKITISTAGDMELNAKNLVINVEEKMAISAGQNIGIDTSTELAISAAAKATIGAPKIEVNGEAEVKVSAANVSIDGQAMVKVSGAVVKLN